MLVIEATRRSIGLALPIIALVFLAYAMLGPKLPDWFFPHRGYGVDRIVPFEVLVEGSSVEASAA